MKGDYDPMIIKLNYDEAPVVLHEVGPGYAGHALSCPRCQGDQLHRGLHSYNDRTRDCFVIEYFCEVCDNPHDASRLGGLGKLMLCLTDHKGQSFMCWRWAIHPSKELAA